MVDSPDGRRVFVKSADAPNVAGWLRREHEVYASVSGGFIPRLEGWDDDGVRPVLVIEDLSDADWVPRWDEARLAAVVDALAEIASSPHPPNTRSLRESFPNLFDRWHDVAADPEPFLSAGIRDRAWLDRCLPVIAEAAAAVDHAGDALLHVDVRSDNLCFRDGRVRRLELGITRQPAHRPRRLAAELDVRGWAATAGGAAGRRRLCGVHLGCLGGRCRVAAA